MKASILLSVAFAGVLLVLPPAAEAQSADRNGRGTGSALPFRATPPRPPGLGTELPPGHGGPNPGEAHRNGNGNARGQLPRIPRVCLPGGALSGEATHGQIGRDRARARVCTP